MALQFLSPLHRATRQIGLWFEGSSEVGSTEGHLLSYLLPYGPCTVSELVRVFGVRHSTMTSILDRLEERGLIQRKTNPADARSLLVGITKKGKKGAARVNAMLEELESAIDSRVTKADVAGFQRVLDAVAEATKVDVRRK